MSGQHRERPVYVPTSTYRLQVHSEFPLPAATAVLGYLRRLGVDTCYTSPYFTASPGSTHGYDVCNHNEINPELGGREAYDAFARTLKAEGLGHIVDFVPNHMGIGTGRNIWWNDVLENGPSSPSARFFDVDWTPVKAELHAKLLLPILGDQYGQVLERAPVLHEFQSIIASLQNMPPYTEEDVSRSAERQREKEVARARLARLVIDSPGIRTAIDNAVRQFNGTPGQPSSFDALHDLLETQAYRLSHWRTASHEINYRRFFDINTLAGLRVENPEVFEATHELLASLIRDRIVDAVRIDHPDGLFDPARYFAMLQDLAARALGLERDVEGRPPDRPLYVVAEKILSGHEQLPPHWAVHGTTGYNYLNDLNGLFIDTAQTRRTRRIYAKLTGCADTFDDVLYSSKRLIMDTAMASELNVLAHMLDRIGESNRKSRDFTLESMRDVITEVVACFPVYRTYVDEHGWRAEDRGVLAQAIARARRRNPAMESSLFDFFREVVLPRDPEDSVPPPGEERRGGYPPADADEARERLRFAMKLQQYTGPVQAKGLEDTAFYRHNVLLSLNEVGGDPSRFGRSIEEFHEANAARRRHWPYEMLATATHDTKLGEDVRARINAISEMPDDWGREVSRWMTLNRTHRAIVDGEPAPERNDEYRFYQALAGVWPLDAGAADAELIARLQQYMLKAVREAKVHTSWLTTNQAYEDALKRFIERTLGGPGAARFIAAFRPMQERLATLGAINSVAQVTLKLGSPGVPDFYQGTDLWDLSLVDPDNRRPVDFAARERWLIDVDRVLTAEPSTREPLVGDLLRNWRDGRIKLLLTAAGLRLRREKPQVFLEGDYLPLATEITVPASAVAFARIAEGPGDAVLFVAPRLCARVSDADHPFPLGGECWKTSRLILPPTLRDRTFRHLMTGAELRPTVAGDVAWLFLGEIFQTLPVGILTS
jgi:(1->4)-alpha-D-glucan 1-alpha-D-glucosylmutase